jgi:hypothetical protein
VKIYDLTSFGKQASVDLPLFFGREWSKLAAVIKKYSAANTNDIIDLSYLRFPGLTINSKIKPEVNRRLLNNLSPLNSMYEEDVGASGGASSSAGFMEYRQSRPQRKSED